MSAASPLAHFDDLFWKQLLGYIEAGLVVPIVGEELLRLRLEGREVSLYTLLAERLAPALGVSAEGLPASGALHEVACRYLDAGGDLEGIYPILQEMMPSRGEIPIPEPLLQLASIRPFRLFVTTTFDPLLGWALDQVRFGGREKTECLAYSPEDPQDLPCEAEKLTEPVVYHLFGKLSAAPEYAVTEEDMIEFLRALQMEDRRPSRLFDALDKKHLLFLGGSFPDWPSRFFLRLAKRERLKLSRSKTDVMADTRAQTDPGLVLFLQRFSTSTKIFQGGGAAELVAEMAERWQKRNPPRPEDHPSTSISGLPGGMREGAIFLSYASEDRQAALALKEALDKAGLDSWLDVDAGNLLPGSSWEEKIHSAIDHSSVFVPLLSQHVLTSSRRYFRTEWDHAKQLAAQSRPDTPFIVPVALDDVSRTSPLLPEAFRQAQWTSLADGQLPPPVLVDTLKQLYRSYQKSLGATP